MDTYSILRHFADSWMLLAMTLFFLGACLWAFRPGARAPMTTRPRRHFRDRRPPWPRARAPRMNCQPKDRHDQASKQDDRHREPPATAGTASKS